jgi:gamma-glutamylcyclotransferase (GGCT)/AIG2-like uncharacterized protein YtfP
MLVFVYGTLTDPDRAAQVLDSFDYEGGATLTGLHRVEGAYPTLAPGGSVTGRLLRTEEIEALDDYEGVDRGLYTRVSVPVESDASASERPGASDAAAATPRSAAVYVGDPDRLDAPVEWPADEPFPACARRFVGREAVYVRIG